MGISIQLYLFLLGIGWFLATMTKKKKSLQTSHLLTVASDS